MLPEANCPRCGKRFERGVLRTQWLTVHPEQMLAALHEAEEAEWQGRSARVFAGTATTIVYRHLRGEKMLHCMYCPDCAVVVAARDGLVVDAPPFSRFARRMSGGHTVFASRLRAWRLVRGVVAGVVLGLPWGAFLLSRKTSLSSGLEHPMIPIVLFAGLGLCWGLWFDIRSSVRRGRALRLKAELDARRQRSSRSPSLSEALRGNVFDFAQGVS
jgi:hypothetical protein